MQLCQGAGSVFPIAFTSMQALVRLGMARELPGQRHNRVFVYDVYLNIRNEGVSPFEFGQGRSEEGSLLF